MIFNRTTRRTLFYVGCLSTLAIPVGVATHHPVISLVGVLVFPLAVYFSFGKMTCPQCGHVIRVIGAQIQHCSKCGAAYPAAP